MVNQDKAQELAKFAFESYMTSCRLGGIEDAKLASQMFLSVAFQAFELIHDKNRILHLFGWAICVEYNDRKEITDCYPARCKFRGFSKNCEEKGFQDLTKYMLENAQEIYDETK